MDLNIKAFHLVQEVTDDASANKKRRKAASRRGGLIGGRARAKALSPEQRKEIATKANQKRWGRVNEEAIA